MLLASLAFPFLPPLRTQTQEQTPAG